MKIIDFLIANYHWILAIILLTIITIIGFLADKKKNDKKKENKVPKQQPDNNNMIMNQQPMQYQPEIQNQINEQPLMRNNMNMDNNITMNQINNNQNLGTIPQPMMYGGEMQNNNNLMNNPQPVENIVFDAVQEPMYQPLEEQKPHFAPQPTTSFDAMKEVQNQSPQIMNNPQTVVNQNVMNQQQMQSSESIEPMPIYNQNANMQENNNYGMQNMITNQGTIPQPVNSIPVPQPVSPQPIMTNQMQHPESMGPMPIYNMNQQIPNQNGLVGNQNHQQPMMQQNQQQMQNPTPMTPINFVYGPQNNNQNM